MPLYTFQNAQGERREEILSSKDAPRWGETIDLDGVAWTRVWEGTMPAMKAMEVDVACVSHSLPRARRDAAGNWHSPYSKDIEPATGKPRFRSMRAVREAEATSRAIDGKHRIEWATTAPKQEEIEE